MRSRLALLLLLGQPVPVIADTLPPSMAVPVSAPVPMTPAAAVPAPSLWRLPTSAVALRFGGESGSLTVPLYVPAGTVPTLKSFQVAFQAAIGVMPEASWITLTINGQTVGRVPVAAPAAVRTVSFAVPPGVVQAGWNAVAIDVQQRHRVDCSLASTYELWTQIDPIRTGFAGSAPRVAAVGDLPALPVDGDGAMRLHLLLPKDPPLGDVQRAVRVAEQIAIRGHFTHPVVDMAPARDGLHVAVGSAADLARLPGVIVRPGPFPQIGAMPNGAPLLVVSGSSEGDLDRAIDALGTTVGDPVGTEEGLKAMARAGGIRLRPGDTIAFTDLGIPTRTFSGRLYREAFDVVLPPDAYPADYGEARLSLDGGYAADLTRDARLVVRVNGIIDGNLEFDRPGGAVLQSQTVHMPLDPFRPGRNRIEIEAQLPARSDDSCDTLNAIGAKERFLLLGTSTLSLPPLARVAQFPNLSATFAGNLRVTPGAPPRVFMPRATEGAVSAAGTLLANASASAGVPTEAVFVRGTPQSGTDPAIVVGTASDMPARLLAAVGVDAPAMAQAWRAAARAPSGEPGRIGSASDAARLDAWGFRVDQGGNLLGGSDSAPNVLIGKFSQSLRSAGLLASADQPVAITGDTSFILAQGLLDDTPVTLITARDDGALTSGTAALLEPARLAGLAGRAATLDATSPGTTLVPAGDTAFFRTQGFSFVNDRLVAAGWVSKHAGWYIGAVLFATLLLGASTWMFLKYGRKEEPA